MYRENNKGPRTVPWGTPDKTGAQSDFTRFTTIRCCLKHRKKICPFQCLATVTNSIAKQFAFICILAHEYGHHHHRTPATGLDWHVCPPTTLFSPRGGVAGIPRGLDSPNSHCPREFDRRLWHRVGTLDVSARYREDVISNFEGTYVHRIFDTKLCHMGKELDPFFFKLSNSLG